MLGGALVLRQPPSISIPLRDHQIAGDFQSAKKNQHQVLATLLRMTAIVDEKVLSKDTWTSLCT
jgi:hypothetical protein